MDPATGQPYPGSVVPVSAQALALLALYPLPNVSGNPLYNYQAPVLNSAHQDVVQLRLDKTLGRRDQLYGNFNLQSMRADAVSLFQFVDATDTLGLNTNINWAHRFNPALFCYADISLQPAAHTDPAAVRSSREHRRGSWYRRQRSGPVEWGPPALSFSQRHRHVDRRRQRVQSQPYRWFLTVDEHLSPRRHNITLGGDLRKQQYNQYFQQDPRGTFTFTGAATGSDLADFLIGIPDTSSIAFGNAGQVSSPNGLRRVCKR